MLTGLAEREDAADGAAGRLKGGTATEGAGEPKRLVAAAVGGEGAAGVEEPSARRRLLPGVSGCKTVDTASCFEAKESRLLYSPPIWTCWAARFRLAMA